MATDTKFNVGDVVSLKGEVAYVYSFGNVDIKGADGRIHEVDARDVVLVKKAGPPRPAPGSVVVFTNKFGTQSKYIATATDEMTYINSLGETRPGFVNWSAVDHNRFTHTVV